MPSSTSTQRLIDILGARPLDELLASSKPINGLDAQTLRSFFTSQCMEPSRDLDSYGRMIFEGDIKGLKLDFEQRVQNITTNGLAHNIAVNQIYSMRWGPTSVPIFNCLLLSTIILPERRAYFLEIVRWLISLGVPVDGKDLSGSTALAHSISTKPSFDPEFARLLIDAGGNINHRNRYGCTPAHEICMVRPGDSQSIHRAFLALKFFLDHGGDPNICDNDGISPTAFLQKFPWLSDLRKLALEREVARKEIGCTFCGATSEDRGAVQLLRCSRCKEARYCASPKGCQRADWKRHKKECHDKPQTPLTSG